MNLQLAPFFDLSMDCLCIAGYDGYFKKINPAFVSLLGYSEEELRSRLISEFIYEEDRELTAKYRQNLENNRPLVNFENRYVCKSGELVWLHWTSIPLENERLIYAIAKDITHKKGLENERISQMSRLSRVNEKLKQLNYATSHDLRSPVNNLISMLDLIDLNKIDDNDTLEVLRFIRISAEGLNTSLNAYVDALKRNDVQHENFEEVSFNEIFEKTKNSIKSLIQKAKVEFHLDFSGLESMQYSAAYMESIFLNLITNSIKYARPGVAPVISITASERNSEKTLVYSDNGLGFDMDKVGHLIFNLNQKFHDNEDSKGVGLYLVHSHITGLGGRISVDSQVNEGSTFTINFRNTLLSEF
ncbi:PAS domain-containing sensor histidine kinase [Pricia sp. S334]|uniref:histidine kinase n=1 Tax=Pricia mediterranea TaxID=3076079 RepID=A0ABU3L2M9_9FLAO|nr:PAS domain-containing sensor histidine kinase [Pricia sp. S334]MDT7827895.1 PAS domain-containing sensor histidine kinase [Pricia sp. S334]